MSHISNFASLSGLQQEALVLAFLRRCGRGARTAYWYDALRSVEASRRQAELDARTAADAARLGMVDAATVARGDAADALAWADEVEAAVAYYHPGSLDAYRSRRLDERADAAFAARAA